MILILIFAEVLGMCHGTPSTQHKANHSNRSLRSHCRSSHELQGDFERHLRVSSRPSRMPRNAPTIITLSQEQFVAWTRRTWNEERY
jgi:hypothetical protein